jgi:hypothetical protein
MNVQETKFTLKHLPPRASVLIQGPHGIGKSEVVRQTVIELTEEENVPYELIDLRLSQKEVGDLIGMPRAVDTFNLTREVYKAGKLVTEDVIAKNVTIFNLPTWFPTNPDSHGYLFLDELNRATREVQQAAFELVLDYRLNFSRLPEGWRVVAAINENTDAYQVLEMDPALMDRFCVVPFDPLTSEWLDYAQKNGVHDAIVKYITKFEKNLFSPKDKIEPGKVYPSPRSWVMLSNAITYMKESKNINLLEADRLSYLMKLSCGYVGSIIGIQFVDFIKKDYKVLTAEDILDRFSDKLSKSLEAMDVPEVGYYNKLLLEYIQKHKKLSKKQVPNLIAYYKVIGKEKGADLFNLLIREAREFMTKLWQEYPEVSDVTNEIMGRKSK